MVLHLIAWIRWLLIAIQNPLSELFGICLTYFGIGRHHDNAPYTTTAESNFSCQSIYHLCSRLSLIPSRNRLIGWTNYLAIHGVATHTGILFR